MFYLCVSSCAGGFIQLIFLMATYSFFLYQGSQLISNGSELLLLVPAVAGIVGSVVLPVLGAVPDGAIGTNRNKQNQWNMLRCHYASLTSFCFIVFICFQLSPSFILRYG